MDNNCEVYSKDWFQNLWEAPDWQLFQPLVSSSPYQYQATASEKKTESIMNMRGDHKLDHRH